jgi:hypothetical protein
MRKLAKRLMAFETPGGTPPATETTVTFRVIDKLRPHLSMLMGRSGFQALLARALVLAVAEVPWLATVHVVADGELEGLTVAPVAHEGPGFSDGEAVLLAQLLRLLEAFIGRALTFRVINQLWPQASFDEAADLSCTADNEEAK